MNNLKKIRYALEAFIVRLGMGLFRILGVKKSSDLGSFLARFIGRLIPVHKLAKDNLIKAIPHLNNSAVDKILNDMWDNLGRIVGEFVHIGSMSGKEITNYVTMNQGSVDNIEYIKNNFSNEEIKFI